jgi:hypothetical protein
VTLLSFAGSPHGGSHKLLPEWRSQPRITPVLIIDHSIVGSALGAWWYFHDRTGIESHFIVRGRRSGSADGHIWQLMDTDRRADANWRANDKAISIETEDDGDPDTQPWTTAQLQSLIWLHNRLVSLHPTIRRREATDCDGPGLGYHSKLGAPSCWTPVAGKTCPGRPVRVRQWQQTLLPAFLHPEEGLSMADVQTILDKLDGMSRLIRVGDRVGGGTDPHDYSSLEGIGRQVAALDSLVRQLYYGDRVGGTPDTHDALSVEGLHRRVEGLQLDVDFLKAAVVAIAEATGATLPPGR